MDSRIPIIQSLGGWPKVLEELEKDGEDIPSYDCRYRWEERGRLSGNISPAIAAIASRLDVVFSGKDFAAQGRVPDSQKSQALSQPRDEGTTLKARKAGGAA